MQKSQDVRKALRFWSERRIRVHFVDFKARAPSTGELQRFVQRFGLTALIDKTSKRYADLGLGAARYDDHHWLEILCSEPLVLRVPLTRCRQYVTIGLAEDEWLHWIRDAKS